MTRKADSEVLGSRIRGTLIDLEGYVVGRITQILQHNTNAREGRGGVRWRFNDFLKRICRARFDAEHPRSHGAHFSQYRRQKIHRVRAVGSPRPRILHSLERVAKLVAELGELRAERVGIHLLHRKDLHVHGAGDPRGVGAGQRFHRHGNVLVLRVQCGGGVVAQFGPVVMVAEKIYFRGGRRVVPRFPPVPHGPVQHGFVPIFVVGFCICIPPFKPTGGVDLRRGRWCKRCFV